MPFPHLPHRRHSLLGLAAAATASVAVLGGVAALFAEAGRTPWVEPGGALAHEARHCREARAVGARHACLRQLAQRQDQAASAVLARAEPPAP